MNVTFLIGNGFDIGVGMKTKYSDFYSEYVKLRSEDDNILEFQKEIRDNIQDWADFEEAFGKHAQYFGVGESEKYLRQYEHFFEYFAEYLKKEENKFEMPDDLEIIKLMEKALKNYYGKLQPQDREDIETFYKWNTGSITYNFINFNYTSILDYFVKLFKDFLIGQKKEEQIGELIHVHGSIEKYMIIGVNDKTQIKNNAFAENKEVVLELVKPTINKELKMGYDKKATKLINQSDVICIYGMSLGATDRKWWSLITKWLKESPTKRLIILNYQPDCDTTRPYTWVKSKTKIINKFFNYSNETSEMKEKLSEQICIGINNNVFSCKKPRRKRGTISNIKMGELSDKDLLMQRESMKLLKALGERQRKNNNDQL